MDINGISSKVAQIGQAMLLMTLSTIVMSAAPTPQEIIIQQQQQREQAEREALIEYRQEKPIELEESPEEAIEEDGPCFDISRIIYNGARVMPISVQEEITAPYINQCINLSKINGLLRHVSNWYFERGYVTSRAYVSAQDLKTGTLQLTIVEGELEKITLSPSTSRLAPGGVFWGMADNPPLNLRDIEQGLEQLNRLGSVQAKMDLLPGTEPGKSTLRVNVAEEKPWRIRFTRDNSGQKSTGELGNSVLFELDNPLGINDYGYISYQEDNLDNSTGNGYESTSLHWDMPLGAWHVGIDVNYFEYYTVIESIFGDFSSTGTSLSQKVFLSNMLYRDNQQKLKAKMTLQRKKSEQFNQDVLLSSSRNLGIATFGIDYTLFTASQGRLDLSGYYHRGLRLFNAPDDHDFAAEAPRAQFDKWTVTVNYRQPVTFNGLLTTPLTYEGKVFIQQSPDTLYASEQISIGGQYTVSGYKGKSISANSGGYWRNNYSLPIDTRSWGGSWVSQIKPYIQIDVGKIKDKENNYESDTYTSLRGWGVGVELTGRYYQLKGSMTRGHNPAQFSGELDSQFHFMLALKY